MKIETKETLRILYLSSVCHESTYKALFRNVLSVVGNIQMQKFDTSLCSGFTLNPKVDFYVFSKRPVTRSTHSKIFWSMKQEYSEIGKTIYLSFINYKILKSLSIFTSGFRAFIEQMSKKRPDFIICDVMDPTLMLLSTALSSIFRVKRVALVTDIPGVLIHQNRSIKYKMLMAFQNFFIKRFSYFVFLSKFMADFYNIDASKYLIIEGMSSSFEDKVEVSNKTKNPRILLYAGQVSRENGIDILIKGFHKLSAKDVELHIYGSGSYSFEVEKWSKIDTRIKYFGTMENKVILQKEKEAHLLINPRPSSQEFVKYSFPSKLIEFMQSGTPVLTTLLPCIPCEYFDFVYVQSDETVLGFSDNLEKLLKLPYDTIKKKGEEAKLFIETSKNNVVQTERIRNFLESRYINDR